jgi:2-isopropylmalate synthase
LISTQVDRNVISASANALVDGFEFGIVEYADSCMLCEVDYDAPPIYSSDDEGPSTIQAMPREVRTAR